MNIPSKIIKSPLNYVGGKIKLLPQLLPPFPNEVNTFVDLFGGGANVSVNIEANRIIYNDIQPQIVDLFNKLKTMSGNEAVKYIDQKVEEYNLTKENKDGYIALRERYNNGERTWDIFYTLVAYAFNNQIRFNSKGEYNMPFGKDRSSFNPTLRQKFIDFVDKINNSNIIFTCKDFSELNVDKLSENDFVYCDPPYLVTCASYNENDGWNETHERKLLGLLDKLNDKNIKFGLSNVFENKGKTNEILKEWVNNKGYNVHHLNHTYSNCNYHAKDRSTDTTDEVLITNY